MNAIVALNQYTAGPFGLCATLMSVFPAKVLLFEEFESRLFITLSASFVTMVALRVYIYILMFGSYQAKLQCVKCLCMLLLQL